MKKIFFVAMAMLSAAIAQAQTKDRDVIASSGRFVSTPTVQVSYTVGETAIQYLSATGASLSQGFQQTNNVGSSIVGVKSLDAVVSTYPNPFVNFIEIKTDIMLNDPVFRLVDANGKSIQISKTEIENGKHWRIDIDALAAGSYWLSIYSEGKQSSYLLTHTAP